MVLRAQPEMRRTVTRGLETIALRMPRHAAALALIRHCGRGLAAPSANRSGRPSPTRASHVLRDLGDRIPLILDGGPCAIGVESTVVDLTGFPTILRPGAVTAADLSAALGLQLKTSGDETLAHRSPGTRYQHYAPETPLWLVDAAMSNERLLTAIEAHAEQHPDQIIGFIGARELSPALQRLLTPIPIEDNAEDFAFRLYDHLRAFDRDDVSLILAQPPSAAPLSAAILDRLTRAAVKRCG
jgi:L-threonylcarbamoyladenylate synthase